MFIYNFRLLLLSIDGICSYFSPILHTLQCCQFNVNTTIYIIHFQLLGYDAINHRISQIDHLGRIQTEHGKTWAPKSVDSYSPLPRRRISSEIKAVHMHNKTSQKKGSYESHIIQKNTSFFPLRVSPSP